MCNIVVLYILTISEKNLIIQGFLLSINPKRIERQVMNKLIECNMSDDLQKDIYGIIENAQQTAIVSVNSVLVIRNWLIGMRISREKMSGTRSEH